MTTRIVAALAVASIFAIGSAKADDFVAPPIPYLQEHNRALEILRTIPAIPPIVAKDDDAEIDVSNGGYNEIDAQCIECRLPVITLNKEQLK